MRIALGFSSLAALGLVCGVLGCSAAEVEEEDVNAGAIKPQLQTKQFELAEHCDKIVREKQGIRENDIKSGNVRWKCGDVAGVRFKPCLRIRGEFPNVERNPDGTPKLFKIDGTESARRGKYWKQNGQLCDNPDAPGDLGQEYCEYHAVLNGEVVDNWNGATDRRDDPNAPSGAKTGELKCVYTSMHADAHPQFDFNVAEHGAALQSKLGLSTPPAPRLVQMQVGFNTRGAADQLILDCQTKAESLTQQEWQTAERVVACLRAWKASPSDEKRTECERDLSDDATWTDVKTKVGAKELADSPDPGLEDADATRDIVACTVPIDFAKDGTIVGWRNSDPMICQRVIRAKFECGDTFAEIERLRIDDEKKLVRDEQGKRIRDAEGQENPVSLPDNFPGFFLTNWEIPNAPPPGCEYIGEADPSKPGGGPNLVVCKVSSNAFSAAKGKMSMQQLCNDQFGKNIAMAAPLGAVLGLRKSQGKPAVGNKSQSKFCADLHSSVK
jgi:hypothetical protein